MKHLMQMLMQLVVPVKHLHAALHQQPCWPKIKLHFLSRVPSYMNLNNMQWINCAAANLTFGPPDVLWGGAYL